MPSTHTGGSGAASAGVVWVMNAACAIGHDNPKWAPAAATSPKPSAIPAPHAARSRVVNLERGGTCGSDSVNEALGQARSRHRHRFLCHTKHNGADP